MRAAAPDVVETDYEIVDARKKPAKYMAGEPIRRLEELDEAFRDGAMLWHRHRPTHAAWIHNLSYGYLLAAMRHGYIRRTVINPAYRGWLRREMDSLPKSEMPF